MFHRSLISRLQSALALLLAIAMLVESAAGATLPGSKPVSSILPGFGLPFPAGLLSTPSPRLDPADPISTCLRASPGLVQNVLQPKEPAKGRVLFILDIHGDVKVQERIQSTVENVLLARRSRLVALEGAFGAISLAPFCQIVDHKVVQEIFSNLLRKRRISGPIVATIQSGNSSPPSVVGIDDRRLYRENVDAFRSSRARKAAVQRLLDREEETLVLEARDRYPDLLAYHLLATRFNSGQVSISSFIANIIGERLCPNQLPPQLEKFAAIAFPDDRTRRQMEEGRIELLSRLVALHPVEIRDLLQRTAGGQENPFRFIEDLDRLASSKMADQSAAVKTYREALAKATRINLTCLRSETEALEDSCYRRLCHSPAESSLAGRLRELSLCRKLISYRLTSEEWLLWEKGRSLLPQELLEELNPFADFYRFASERDSAMAGRLIDLLSHRPKELAILVTGGFHSNGIINRLLKNGIAVTIFSPWVNGIDQEGAQKALDQMVGDRNSFDVLFPGTSSFLADNPASDSALFEASNAIVGARLRSSAGSADLIYRDHSVATGWQVLKADKQFNGDVLIHEQRPGQLTSEVWVNVPGRADAEPYLISPSPLDRLFRLAERIQNLSFETKINIISILAIVAVACSGNPSKLVECMLIGITVYSSLDSGGWGSLDRSQSAGRQLGDLDTVEELVHFIAAQGVPKMGDRINIDWAQVRKSVQRDLVIMLARQIGVRPIDLSTAHFGRELQGLGFGLTELIGYYAKDINERHVVKTPRWHLLESLEFFEDAQRRPLIYPALDQLKKSGDLKRLLDDKVLLKNIPWRLLVRHNRRLLRQLLRELVATGRVLDRKRERTVRTNVSAGPLEVYLEARTITRNDLQMLATPAFEQLTVPGLGQTLIGLLAYYRKAFKRQERHRQSDALRYMKVKLGILPSEKSSNRISSFQVLRDKIAAGDFNKGRQTRVPWDRVDKSVRREAIEALARTMSKAPAALSSVDLTTRRVRTLGITLKSLYNFYDDLLKANPVRKTTRWVLLEKLGFFVDAHGAPLPLRAFDKLRQTAHLRMLLDSGAIQIIPWEVIDETNKPLIVTLLRELTATTLLRQENASQGIDTEPTAEQVRVRAATVTVPEIRRVGVLGFNVTVPTLGRNLKSLYNHLSLSKPAGGFVVDGFLARAGLLDSAATDRIQTVQQLQEMIASGEIRRNQGKLVVPWDRVEPAVQAAIVEELATTVGKPVLELADRDFHKKIPILGQEPWALLRFYQRIAENEAKEGRWVLLEAIGAIKDAAGNQIKLPSLRDIRSSSDLARIVATGALRTVPWDLIERFNRTLSINIAREVAAIKKSRLEPPTAGPVALNFNDAQGLTASDFRSTRLPAFPALAYNMYQYYGRRVKNRVDLGAGQHDRILSLLLLTRAQETELPPEEGVRRRRVLEWAASEGLWSITYEELASEVMAYGSQSVSDRRYGRILGQDEIDQLWALAKRRALDHFQGEGQFNGLAYVIYRHMAYEEWQRSKGRSARVSAIAAQIEADPELAGLPADELATRLGTTIETLVAARRPVSPSSLDTPVASVDENDTSFAGSIADPKGKTPYEIASEREILARVLAQLNPQSRRLLDGFASGKTGVELARELGITPAQAQQALQRVLDSLPSLAAEMEHGSGSAESLGLVAAWRPLYAWIQAVSIRHPQLNWLPVAFVFAAGSLEEVAFRNAAQRLLFGMGLPTLMSGSGLLYVLGFALLFATVVHYSGVFQGRKTEISPVRWYAFWAPERARLFAMALVLGVLQLTFSLNSFPQLVLLGILHGSAAMAARLDASETSGERLAAKLSWILRDTPFIRKNSAAFPSSPRNVSIEAAIRTLERELSDRTLTTSRFRSALAERLDTDLVKAATWWSLGPALLCGLQKWVGGSLDGEFAAVQIVLVSASTRSKGMALINALRFRSANRTLVLVCANHTDQEEMKRFANGLPQVEVVFGGTAFSGSELAGTLVLGPASLERLLVRALRGRSSIGATLWMPKDVLPFMINLPKGSIFREMAFISLFGSRAVAISAAALDRLFSTAKLLADQV